MSAVLNFQIIPDTFIFFLYYHIFGSLGGSESETKEWRISAEKQKSSGSKKFDLNPLLSELFVF